MIPFVPQLLGGLGLALFLSLGFNGCQHQRNAVVKLERDAAKLDAAQAKAAITGKDTTIAKLEAGLKSWQQAAERSEAQAREAGDRAEALAQSNAVQRRQLQEQERRDDGQMGCQSLLDTDIAAVCGARADGVRRRAADGLRRATD